MEPGKDMGQYFNLIGEWWDLTDPNQTFIFDDDEDDYREFLPEELEYVIAKQYVGIVLFGHLIEISADEIAFRHVVKAVKNYVNDSEILLSDVIESHKVAPHC